MSSSSEELENPLESVARPLRYAARNDYRNLGVLKSLEAALTQAIARARVIARKGSDEARALEQIAPLVAGFDRADDRARIARVQKILELIDGVYRVEGKAGVEGKATPEGKGGENPSAGAPVRARSHRAGGEAKALGDPEAGVEGKATPERKGRENPSAGAPVRARSRRAGGEVKARGDPEAGVEGKARGEPEAGVEGKARGDPEAGVEGKAGVEAKPARRKRGRVAPPDALPGTPLSSIAGIGPKTAERLAAKGLVTVQEVLLFLPRRYEDRRAFRAIAELAPGEYATVRAEVLALAVRFRGPGRRVFELAVGDGSQALSCRWFRFNASAMENRYHRGQRVIVSGTVTAWGAARQMVHPDVELVTEGEDRAPAGWVPIYGEVDGVPPKTLRKIIVDLARGAAERIPDPLPPSMRAELRLAELGQAILSAHDPSAGPSRAGAFDPSAGPPPASPDKAAAAPLRRRLVFDELFFFQLALALRRRGEDEGPGLPNAASEPWIEIARSMLPFALTGGQHRALDAVAADLAAPRPMHRLLQGEVGSGKTAVAMVAAAIVCAAGRQTAILAPTEILAEQHHKSAARLLASRGLRVRLLTGSTRAAERREILDLLSRGLIDVCIGTHALLEPDVRFQALGLAIVDEQHRFGVEQRAALSAKSEGAKPDMLVMTATPIPRTLALTVYGDLRVTVLDELPPGRSPVATQILPASKRAEAHRQVESEIAKGRQAYVVFPLVEASERLDLVAATDAVEELTERFRPHQVALLHGRMPAEEKSRTMDAFVRGDTAVLVSTTVVEVGVDVANATVMMIEHAERFGLSQLHQLRGRVGRGRDPGRCLLIAGGGGGEARARLAILESSSDGFRIAEQDLVLRGPGELLGTRQAGLPDLVLADLIRDAPTLEEARTAAFQLVESDPMLAQPQHAAIATELKRRFATRLGLIDVG